MSFGAPKLELTLANSTGLRRGKSILSNGFHYGHLSFHCKSGGENKNWPRYRVERGQRIKRKATEEGRDISI